MYTSCIFLILSFYFSVFFFTNIIEKDVLLSYLGVCKTILKNLHITTHGIQKFFLSLFHKMFFFTRVFLNLINRYLKNINFHFTIQKLLDILVIYIYGKIQLCIFLQFFLYMFYFFCLIIVTIKLLLVVLSKCP